MVTVSSALILIILTIAILLELRLALQELVMMWRILAPLPERLAAPLLAEECIRLSIVMIVVLTRFTNKGVTLIRSIVWVMLMCFVMTLAIIIVARVKLAILVVIHTVEAG